MGFWQRLGVLFAPWAFVLLFAGVWFGVLFPRALEGNWALACVSAFAALALVASFVAAATFSRDVLTGRWP